MPPCCKPYLPKRGSGALGWLVGEFVVRSQGEKVRLGLMRPRVIIRSTRNFHHQQVQVNSEFAW